MKTQKKLLYAVAIGFMSLFIWNIILSWINFYCNMVIAANACNADSATAGAPAVIKMQEPNELVNPALVNSDYRPGGLVCNFYRNDFFISRSMGIVSSIERSELFPDPLCYKFNTHPGLSLMFAYDKTLRQLVVREIEYHPENPIQKVVGYIGPKGYSAQKNPGLGTFEKPLFARDRYYWLAEDPNRISLFLCDAGCSRFYRIEMNSPRKIIDKNTYYEIQLNTIQIIEGPKQEQPDWNPVQIGGWISGAADDSFLYSALRLDWTPPSRVEREPYPGSQETFEKNVLIRKEAPRSWTSKPKLFVLHQDGRIDYVDGESLKVVKRAGFLPEIGFYEHSRSRCLRAMADYAVMGLYDPNGLHLGTAVAAASRDGIMTALDFYDAKGNLRAHKSLGNDNTGVSLMWNVIPDGAPVLKIRYLLENLQSPLLRLLDLPAARFIEPANQYSTLFVRPVSLVGLMKVELDQFEFWFQLLLLMLPSLAVSLWLGGKSRQKSVSLGFDTLAKDIWFIAILAFGIPAYITFKLMLPKEKMVTCANCGNLRRVEFENCQSCKRDWQKTKSLTTAPDWCVTDTSNPAKSEVTKT